MTILRVFLISIFFLSCSSDDNNPINQIKNESQSINKILPLGASRVDGLRPFYESYRYELWKKLLENNWEFDFIGTQQDNATYPSVNSITFDNEHEGRGGWTSGQIANNIDAWIDEEGAADIVLFSTPGGNDALHNLPFDEAIVNIKNIINSLQENNPNIIIIVEKPAPGKTSIMTPTLTNYLNNLSNELTNIVAENNSTTSRIIIVDMNTSFTDDLLADDVHYNEDGARFIANRYYDVLKNILSN